MGSCTYYNKIGYASEPSPNRDPSPEAHNAKNIHFSQAKDHARCPPSTNTHIWYKTLHTPPFVLNGKRECREAENLRLNSRLSAVSSHFVEIVNEKFISRSGSLQQFLWIIRFPKMAVFSLNLTLLI